MGEAFFALGDMVKTRAAFEKSNELQPGYVYAVAGLAITLHRLGQVEQAKSLWQGLVQQDTRYRDVAWVKDELRWEAPLVGWAREPVDRIFPAYAARG